MIETVPLEHAADAYARMMDGKARFRMVLVTGNNWSFAMTRQRRPESGGQSCDTEGLSDAEIADSESVED